MDPVISPVIIYVLVVLSNFASVLIGLTVVAGLIAVLSLMPVLYAIMEDEIEESYFEKGLKMTKRATIVLVSALMLNVFIPSKEMMITIFVANELTEQRVSTLAEGGKNVYRTIINDVGNLLDVDVSELQDKDPHENCHKEE